MKDFLSDKDKKSYQLNRAKMLLSSLLLKLELSPEEILNVVTKTVKELYGKTLKESGIKRNETK